ncbi:LPS export ABC transporter periplasmic protein LptC [Entomomonas asaccharolytica]|uniref:LPS export ABC transporter periplasmic protein LptC n=1 Tax=Entomomonas asaccharolytica TaxID=2785331 RepID=A0A974NH93_9GAMM|nr:LPS export ABC transporter periplasmic protein LptC [Entomomonas asaccharolytica]QQP86532.1 LPS export ABC transporter periplasmic protein LptC [Entomomonas asaccharolytica]
MSRSFIYKFGILLLLVVLVAIFEYFDEDAIKIDTKFTNKPTIDYFASDVNVIQYKEDGTTDYKMTTEKLTHVEETDISYLTNPTAHIYKEAAHPWFIKSDKGEVGPKGDEVKLINNIKGTQIDEQGQTNTFEIGQAKNQSDPVKYGQVMIYPDKKYAESSDYAIVTSPDGETSGNGVKAYFETNRIQILSNVRTKINRGQNAN